MNHDLIRRTAQVLTDLAEAPASLATGKRTTRS
jgi:hypothetical protein